MLINRFITSNRADLPGLRGFHFEPPISAQYVWKSYPHIVRELFRWADTSLFENPADAFGTGAYCVWDVGGEEHARSKLED